MRPRSGKRAAQDNWLIQKYYEMLINSAVQPKGGTVIHGTDGWIEIDGKRIEHPISKWMIAYDPAERGKSMKNKHRINALEREVKQLMGTVEQLREQQRSNSSAVRSAIVSIADIQREQSAMNDALRIHAHSISEHSAEHTAQKATPYTSLSAAQRDIRAELAALRTAINEQRAEMLKGDRNLGEIVTNNRNHAILDKRQAERQLAAVQVQLAGLKEWAELTDTAESGQNERLIAIGSELRALKEWASLSEKHNESINHLELEQSALNHRIANMRCAVSLGMYDDLRERVALVEKLLDTPHSTPGKQLYQIDQATGQYVAVEPPVWYSELPALLQSLRSEIDALLAAQSSTIAAEIARVSGRVSQTREYVEQLHDRVDTVSKSAHTHHPG